MQVLWGVCVPRSQNLSVVSPLPLASWRPSGLKAVASTASVCPAPQPHLAGDCRPQQLACSARACPADAASPVRAHQAQLLWCAAMAPAGRLQQGLQHSGAFLGGGWRTWHRGCAARHWSHPKDGLGLEDHPQRCFDGHLYHQRQDVSQSAAISFTSSETPLQATKGLTRQQWPVNGTGCIRRCPVSVPCLVLEQVGPQLL